MFLMSNQITSNYVFIRTGIYTRIIPRLPFLNEIHVHFTFLCAPQKKLSSFSIRNFRYRDLYLWYSWNVLWWTSFLFQRLFRFVQNGSFDDGKMSAANIATGYNIYEVVSTTHPKKCRYASCKSSFKQMPIFFIRIKSYVCVLDGLDTLLRIYTLKGAYHKSKLTILNWNEMVIIIAIRILMISQWNSSADVITKHVLKLAIKRRQS